MAWTYTYYIWAEDAEADDSEDSQKITDALKAAGFECEFETLEEY